MLSVRIDCELMYAIGSVIRMYFVSYFWYGCVVLGEVWDGEDGCVCYYGFVVV